MTLLTFRKTMICFALIFSLPFLGSCVLFKTVHVQVEPRDDSVIWIDGRKALEKENELAYVRLMFEDVKEDCYVFHVEVQNRSEQNILAAPESFYYLFRTAMSHAIDPEKKLKHMQADIENFKWHYEFMTKDDERGGHHPTSEAVDRDETPEDRKKRLEDEENERRERKKKHREYKQELALMNEAYRDVEMTILRKNTLKPGQSIDGRIYFPAADLPDNISEPFKISIPVNTTAFSFDYAIEKVVEER